MGEQREEVAWIVNEVGKEEAIDLGSSDGLEWKRLLAAVSAYSSLFLTVGDAGRGNNGREAVMNIREEAEMCWSGDKLD